MISATGVVSAECKSYTTARKRHQPYMVVQDCLTNMAQTTICLLHNSERQADPVSPDCGTGDFISMLPAEMSGVN